MSKIKLLGFIVVLATIVSFAPSFTAFADDPIEDPVEEPVEEVIEEVIEDPVEEPVEEVIEEVIEDPVEEPVEEVIEEPTDVVPEAPAEELPEAAIEESTEEVTVIDFNQFEAGATEEEISAALPEVDVHSGDPNHPVMIFDTENPTGNDFDLQTPGYGEGNNEPLEEVAIIDEHNDPENPDDNASGGYMNFNFLQEVLFLSLDFIDVEEPAESTVTVNDADGNTQGVVQVETLDDNSVQTLPINLTGSQLIIFLSGSGAVDNITYSTPVPTVEEPTEEPNEEPVEEPDEPQPEQPEPQPQQPPEQPAQQPTAIDNAAASQTETQPQPSDACPEMDGIQASSEECSEPTNLLAPTTQAVAVCNDDEWRFATSEPLFGDTDIQLVVGTHLRNWTEDLGPGEDSDPEIVPLRCDEVVWTRNGEVWRSDRPGTNQRQLLVDYSPLPSQGDVAADALRNVYYINPYNNKVMVTNLSNPRIETLGFQAVEVETHPFSNLLGAISTNGSLLLATINQSETNVYQMVWPYTEVPFQAHNLSFDPDGSKMYFEVIEQSGIWSLNLLTWEVEQFAPDDVSEVAHDYDTNQVLVISGPELMLGTHSSPIATVDTFLVIGESEPVRSFGTATAYDVTYSDTEWWDPDQQAIYDVTNSIASSNWFLRIR